MPSPDRILEKIKGLPPDKQRKVLDFAESLEQEHAPRRVRRVPGKDLLDLPGLFPQDDLKEIEEAVRGCRQVDANGW